MGERSEPSFMMLIPRWFEGNPAQGGQRSTCKFYREGAKLGTAKNVPFMRSCARLLDPCSPWWRESGRVLCLDDPKL